MMAAFVLVGLIMGTPIVQAKPQDTKLNSPEGHVLKPTGIFKVDDSLTSSGGRPLRPTGIFRVDDSLESAGGNTRTPTGIFKPDPNFYPAINQSGIPNGGSEQVHVSAACSDYADQGGNSIDAGQFWFLVHFWVRFSGHLLSY